MKTVAFWFRRDLRLDDNAGLFFALKSGLPVLPVFIFDTEITSQLERNDPRINFIYDRLKELDQNLKTFGSSLLILKGEPVEIWKEIVNKHQISAIFTNHNYEPYAIQRDLKIKTYCQSIGITFQTYKDQVIFEKDDVLKDDGKPYTVFTPYKRKWLLRLEQNPITSFKTRDFFDHFIKTDIPFPTLMSLGFRDSKIRIRPYNLKVIETYDQFRNFPSSDQGSYLGPHLRFGTVSIRQLVQLARKRNETFLSELIWREFFMQILYHFPQVANRSFKAKYDKIEWRNDEKSFERWCQGNTGFPMVDAGMRQLNATGYMHNRVRMIAASFLCKHLLTDWRWGEAYFAEKLLDYELSSNNGNWQWAAGTGCDAAPYFRIFNPIEQQKKFDPDFTYIKQWVPEQRSLDYAKPVVDHAFARQRAIDTYKSSLNR